MTNFGRLLRISMAGLGAIAVWAATAAGQHPESLEVGFAKVDITPPPGVRMFGYWDESRTAVGVRTRLYARAMVMRDRRGDTLAIVVADLGAISGSLHQAVADSVGLGRDRLVLAATGTHSGPGHFFDAGLLNRVSADVLGTPEGDRVGYLNFEAPFRRPQHVVDLGLRDRLGEKIGRAVSSAMADMRPARIFWTQDSIVHRTRARILTEEGQRRGAETTETWTMLGVQVRDRGAMVWRDRGALSVFGMHGNGYPAANDLLDGDIQGLISQRFEEAFIRRDSTEVVHLMANGTLGNSSPNLPEATRCGPPTLERVFEPRGPRTGAPAEVFARAPEADLQRCLDQAREAVVELADTLATFAYRKFNQGLGQRAGCDGPGFDCFEPDPLLGRAYRSLPLPSATLAGAVALCGRATLGLAFVGGPADAPSRYSVWERYRQPTPSAGSISGPIEPDSMVADDEATARCLTEREHLSWLLPSELLGSPELPQPLVPRVAQLQVLRIGSTLIGVTPAAVTREAGGAITEAMWDQARDFLDPPARPLLISLANGYMLYAPTAEEYLRRSFEGAATLYGVHTAAVLEENLRALVAEYGKAGIPRDPVLQRIQGLPEGSPRSFAAWDLLRDSTGHTAHSLSQPVCEVAMSTGFARTFEWVDTAPLDPSDLNRLRIMRVQTAAIIADDGDPSVEIRRVGDRAEGGQRWRVTWRPSPPSGEPVRVVLPWDTVLPRAATGACEAGRE